MMKIKHCLLLLFPVVLTASTALSKLRTEKEKWYLLHTSGYSISYPMAWVADTSSHYMGTDFILYAPAENRKDAFRTNIRLVRVAADKKTNTLEDFALKYIRETGKTARDMKLISSGATSHATAGAWKCSYECRESTFMLHHTQWCFLHKQEFYVLTFSAEKSHYAQYEAMAVKIINSFVLK
ncbi:MAG: hypothetical protein JNL88_08310 [Bacteroidia bacterium]|nr:hypothetical protein [Bacteroidia bacterium]